MRRALDRVPEHMADTSRVRSERRRHARGQALRDEAHALEDASPREVEVHVVLEDGVDHREAERGLRPDHAHTGEALQVRGERVRHLVLDLLRAMTGPVGEDNDLVIREVGNRVDRRGRQCPPSPACEAEVQNDDDEPILQCNVNESIDHALPRRSRAAIKRRRRAARVRTRTYAPGPAVRADTRDDSEWLNEVDGEEDVLRHWRDWHRRRGAPSVTQNESGDIGGKDSSGAENRHSDGGDKHGTGLARSLAL